jgi:4-amino-4-deoxychorismate lyase
MMLINGESKRQLDVSDRSFQYGDGLFETIAVKNGLAVFLDRHLQRLNTGCQRLCIPFPRSDLLNLEISELIQQWVRSTGSTQAVLKIIVTRGSGGRGYRQPDTLQPTRIVSLYPYPDYPQSYAERGITVRFCSTRLGLNPSLAGLKHLNRLEQVMARSEWSDPSIQEGLMLDVNDHVIEGTMTNLFYCKNNHLYTAALTHSGVAGIMRSILIELAIERGLSVNEQLITTNQLLSADEAFVCNSIIGIWPIKQIENSHFSVGPITQRFQDGLEQLP